MMHNGYGLRSVCLRGRKNQALLELFVAGNAADVERRLDALDTCLETIQHDIKQIKLNLQEVKEKKESSRGDEGA